MMSLVLLGCLFVSNSGYIKSVSPLLPENLLRGKREVPASQEYFIVMENRVLIKTDLGTSPLWNPKICSLKLSPLRRPQNVREC